MTPPCPCGRPHHSKGLCHNCYQKQLRPAHRQESLAQRQARVAEAQEKYPSTLFDDLDWYIALRDDDGLYNKIMDDMAFITGRRVRRGKLILDRDGREVEGTGT